MRDRRQQVLDTIQQATEPVGVAEIADHLNVHPNTARFHIETLVNEGIIDRVPDTPSGPGRPRVGYRARPGLARGGARRYRELAELLLGHLSATSDDPTAAATAVGRTWGAHLVHRPAPLHDVTRSDAVERLTVMLDELDFAPEPVADRPGPPDRVRLRHCPFLELAEPHRDLVCPLHLGLMQGALAELRAPITVTALIPFAEPTACLAHLARSPAR
jgi:predicted ArsR family transcriptional regulator